MPKLTFHKAHAPPCRNGAILVVVMVVVLALSFLGAALLSMGDGNGVEAVRETQAAQTFWTAEAGLHHVIARLRAQSAYRVNPVPVEATFVDGSYRVTVGATGTLFTLTSQARNSQFRRTLVQVVSVEEDAWPDAFSGYALFATEGNIDLKKGLSISGSMFAYGNISLAKETTVSNGEVYATGVVVGSGAFTVGTVNEDLPEKPLLDTSWYDGQIAQAAAATNAAPAFPLDPGGGTLYVHGDLAIGDITGAGTIVASGNLALGQDVTIAPGVRLIAGAGLTIDKSCATSSNVLFYAGTSITLAKDGLILNGCALITPGDIDAQKTFTLGGILFAGGNIWIKKDAYITGSVVSGTGTTADMDLVVNHDISAFPPWIPPGFTPTTAIYDVAWEDRGSTPF
jgi:predicted acyltransferase (DUF342 family)